MSKTSELKGVPKRYFVPDPAVLFARIGKKVPTRKRYVEHVYLDTAYPSLFYTGFVRGRRVVSGDTAPFSDKGPSWFVEQRASSTLPVVVHPNQAEALSDIAVIAGEQSPFVEGTPTDLLPCFGVRYERHRYEEEGLRIDVDHDVTYFSLLGHRPFPLGREAVPRVTVRTSGKRKHDKRVHDLLEDVPRGPTTTKKWMGFYFQKACYELPRFDDLPGYEYELKLDVESLDVDLGRLPFPVVEVNQSDSLRRYYRDYRACLRGDRAHLVEKGPVTSYDGVLKRPETKRHGMAPWEMPRPQMVMRRYKREINVLNPDTGRLYTLSLHHCVARTTFNQLEIEYDGRLVPGAVTEMARFRLDHDTRHFLTMAARADAQGWTRVGDALRDRYLQLTPGAFDAADVRSAMRGPTLLPTETDPLVEAQVLDDMHLLREVLTRQAGYRPSRKTKRKWLRKVYAKR